MLTLNRPDIEQALSVPNSFATPAFPDDGDIILPTGKSLKSARRGRGLSQVDLAGLLSVSQSRVSAWENGYDEIPYRQRLKLLDILTNRNGVIDPLISRIIKNTPNLVIYLPDVIDGRANLRYVHASPAVATQFAGHKSALDNQVASKFRYSGLREIEYAIVATKLGRGLSPDVISLDVERDLPVFSRGTVQKSVRLYTQQYALQFDGYPKIIVTRHHVLGPAKGEMQRLHNQTFLQDYDHR